MSKNAVMEYYASRAGMDVLYMLQADGARPPQGFYDVMHRVLCGGVTPERAVSGLLKTMGVRRALFRGGFSSRVPQEDIRRAASMSAALRLCREYHMEAPVPSSAAAYTALGRRLYQDIYKGPAVRPDPGLSSRMDDMLSFLAGGIDRNLDAIRGNSLGASAPARRFAATEITGFIAVAPFWDLFPYGGGFLALETVRRIAMAYGCSVDFSGMRRDDAVHIASMARERDDGGFEAVLSRISYAGLPEA